MDSKCALSKQKAHNREQLQLWAKFKKKGNMKFYYLDKIIFVRNPKIGY